MRCLLALALLVHTAHAEIGFLEEGGIGTSDGRGFLAEDGGGMAVRASLGARRDHFGGELLVLMGELGGDASGLYSTLSAGPMITVRQQFLHAQLDRSFARWFEVHGRIGPTYTWVIGDPADGPLERASGPGFAAGAGLRFVYAAVCLGVDVTVVKTHVQAAGRHDPADELGVRDVPGVDVHGTIVITTVGFGFAL